MKVSVHEWVSGLEKQCPYVYGCAVVGSVGDQRRRAAKPTSLELFIHFSLAFLESLKNVYIFLSLSLFPKCL